MIGLEKISTESSCKEKNVLSGEVFAGCGKEWKSLNGREVASLGTSDKSSSFAEAMDNTDLSKMPQSHDTCKIRRESGAWPGAQME